VHKLPLVIETLMLFRFFLTRFITRFILIFCVIISLLSASNIITRSSILIFPNYLLSIFIIMLPFLSLFAFPLSSGLAVHLAIGDLLINDELLILQYLKKARAQVYKALIVFTLFLVTIYVPLVLYWAPQSYLMGKRLIISLAQQQLSSLEPQKFHSVFPGFTLLFSQKFTTNTIPQCKNIFLVLTNKNNERYFFTAQKGFFYPDKLLLQNGSILTVRSGRYYNAIFAQTDINIKKLLGLTHDEARLKNLKFCTIKELLNLSGKRNRPVGSLVSDNNITGLRPAILLSEGNYVSKSDIYYELLKRGAYIFWLILFPFLAFWSIIIWGQKKSNIITSAIICGVLFLIFYVTIGISFYFWNLYWALGILLLYGVPACIFMFLNSLYKYKFN